MRAAVENEPLASATAEPLRTLGALGQGPVTYLPGRGHTYQTDRDHSRPHRSAIADLNGRNPSRTDLS